MSVAIVLVSHSAQLAAGLVEVAEQMAPDVRLRAAGGTDDGGIGTGYDLVEREVTAALEAGAEVLVLTDLGSATLTAEAVLEAVDDERVQLVDAPFVEAAVAAAVAAQGGGALDVVAAAARSAITAFDGGAADPPSAAPAPDGDPEALTRTLTLANPLGLHARPAATVARMVAELDARVSINDVDAASVLALMALGLAGGAEVRLRASGPQAQQALDAVAAEIESGFGEV